MMDTPKVGIMPAGRSPYGLRMSLLAHFWSWLCQPVGQAI
jgi:hypothetical protein